MTHRLKLSVALFTSILVINVRLSSTNQTTTSEAWDTSVTFIPSSTGYEGSENTSVTFIPSSTSYEVNENTSVAVTLWSTSYTAGDETTVPPILPSLSSYSLVEERTIFSIIPSLSSDTDADETTFFSITPSLTQYAAVEETTIPQITSSLTSYTVVEETDSSVTSSSSKSDGQDTSVASILPSASSTEAHSTILSSSTVLSSSSSTTDSSDTTDITSSSSDSLNDSSTTPVTTPSLSISAYDSSTDTDITPSLSTSAYDSSTDVTPSPSSPVYDISTPTDVTPSSSSPVYDSSTNADITLSSSSPVYDTSTTTDVTLSSSSPVYDTSTTTDVTPSSSSPVYDSSTNADITLSSSSPVYDTSTTTDVTLSSSSPVYDTSTTTDVTPSPSSPVYDSSTTTDITPSSSMTADMTTTSPATPSSSSQSTVTSAVTSVSSTTSPPSTKYPPQTPDLEGAVFIFTFGIEGSNLANFTLIWLRDLKWNVTHIFRENLVGVEEVRIHGNLHERKRRQATSSGVDIDSKFSARDLNKVDKKVLQENLTRVMKKVETTVKNFSYNLDPTYEEKIASFAALTSDVCNSQQSSKKLCGVEYKCTGGVCQHLCEHTYCGGHGQCYVHLLDSEVSTKCQCTSQNPYNYEGVACELAVMKEQYVAAIAVSVFGVVLLVLVGVVVYLCRHYNRKSARTPRDELIPLDQAETWSYKSLPAKHSLAYANHGYESHYMAYRETDPAVYEFRALPRDRSRDSYDVRLREPGLASFSHPISERKFSIKRPQVSSQPGDPE